MRSDTLVTGLSTAVTVTFIVLAAVAYSSADSLFFLCFAMLSVVGVLCSGDLAMTRSQRIARERREAMAHHPAGSAR